MIKFMSLNVILIVINLVNFCHCCDVWPKPAECNSSHVQNLIEPDTFGVQFNASYETCDIFMEVVQRYRRTFFADDCSLLSPTNKKPQRVSRTWIRLNSKANLQILQLDIQNFSCPDVVPIDADEYYEIKVHQGTAKMSSNTIWGLIRGFETFSQLIKAQQTGNGMYTFTINNTEIKDWPRFGFRGFLVDSSRHFLSVQRLYEMLDLMAINKMNVLHWHIVDDQSFPYTSLQFPKITDKGSFSPKHVYSQEDVANIISYGRLRGLRIIPEFDSPGHTLSWGKGQPGLLTSCYKSGAPDGTFGPVDPSNQTNYDFLSQFFKEIQNVFPDAVIHLGGDEVDFDCWKSNPQITEFMRKNKIESYEQLESFYFQELLSILSGLKKQYIVWQEVFDNNVQLDPSTLIHVWKGNESEYKAELAHVTANGYRTILSSPWYLNYISYGIDWPNYYKVDPQDIEGSDEQKKLIIGGAACIWGEYVDNINLISRSFARALAVSERLWSTKETTDLQDAQKRISSARCNFISRGYHAESVTGPGFCKCDYLL